ncbi:MAG: efflux RND transporter periplasmic adaptor subunit [Bacteroidales bacterium]|nr:efflux RND transporter periplasmic adaptor subunit [Bacteroidales bacterium]
MKKIVLLAGVCLMLAACGSELHKTEFAVTVKADTVGSTAQKIIVSYPGKIKASEDVNIAFRVSGTILKTPKKQGDFVRKGEVICEMDSRDYALQYKATEAEYNQTKAECERVMALYEKKSVTLSQYEKAKYGLQQITAKYENHKNQLADTKLRAPFDGYIQKYLYDPNETVGAGMPVVSMIASGTPEVEINISATDFMRRDRIETCVCHSELIPGVDFQTKILGINQKSNLNQLYGMRLALKDNGGVTPAPGATVMVDIQFKSDERDIPVIPLSCMFESDGSTCVWIIRDDNTLEKRVIVPQDVKLDGSVAVKQGLRTGERVVSAGINSVYENQKVKVLDSKTKSNIGGLL